MNCLLEMNRVFVTSPYTISEHSLACILVLLYTYGSYSIFSTPAECKQETGLMVGMLQIALHHGKLLSLGKKIIVFTYYFS